MKLDKNTKKCEQTGLLSGLSLSRKKKCALDLVNMVTFMINSSKKMHYESEKKTHAIIATMIFPIIRRWYDTDRRPLPSPRNLYNHFLRYCVLTKDSIHAITKEDEEMICCEYPKYLSKNYHLAKNYLS